MILELLISRGLGVRIDGHAPSDPDWGYGENDGNTGFEFNKPLHVGPHVVESIDFNMDMEAYAEGEKATTITLKTTEGTFDLPVIEDFAGNEETITRVTLTDGSTRDIDAYISYLRAGDGPPATKEVLTDEDLENLDD